MFSGDAATHVDAFVQDLVAREQHALDLFGVAFVEQQDRMDVAVAGVEDVDDADAVPRARLGDELQDLGQLRARHDAVLRAVTGAQAADRAERLLAALPQQQPFFRRIGGAHLAGPRLAADLDDFAGFVINGDFEPVDFDEQDGRRV